MELDQNTIIFISVIFTALIASIITALYFIFKMREEGRLERSLNMVLFVVMLPGFVSEKEGEKKEAKNFIAIFEQFLTGLSEITDKGFFKDFIYGKPYLVFEIAVPANADNIFFYISAPRKFVDIVERQIHSFFPAAVYEKTHDYNVFVRGGYSAGSYVSLNKHYLMPIHTYQRLEVDPLNAITNSLSKLSAHGEGGSVQFLFAPARGWQMLGNEVVKQMQKGLNFGKALEKARGGFLEIFRLEKKDKEPRPLTPMQEEEIKSISEKIQKIGFAVNVRLAASATTKARAEEILSQLEKSFSQFATPNLNSFKINRLAEKKLEKSLFQFSFRLFDVRQKMILNTEELASLFHFPTPYLETPKIKYLTSKKAPPPVNLPQEGVTLGVNNYRGIETVVKMTRDDRRRHLYIIGQTGTGKSYLMQNIMRQDMENGDGCCYIDPHGEAIDFLLGTVPKNRADDVIVFDPSDLERPLAINFLEYDPAFPEQKTFIVNELLNILDRMYDLKATGGPMFEQYLRNTLMLLMEYPEKGFTLMEVPKVLADAEFRRSLLVNCQNIIVKEFWEKEAEKAGGEAALANMVPYITSKFNVFIANDYMRPIIGQSKSSLNFADIMNNKKILVVNLSKGKVGDLNSQLLGAIIVGKLTQAALARVNIPQEQRNDFYLYIDEFQNYTTPSISTILSEARKYRLCLGIAHQFIGQLPEDISKAVFGNIGSMALFRVGPEDADFLVKFLEPVFSSYDLVNLDNRNALMKLLINGAVSQPFNLMTVKGPDSDPEIFSIVKDLSRLKFGRDRAIIEEEIKERYRQAF